MKIISSLLLLVVGPNLLIADDFSNWDYDKSGTLQRAELPAALRANFDRVDKDQNGLISRQEHKEFLAKSGRASELEGYEFKLDVPYAETDNPRQMIDLYLPKKKSDEPVPILVFVHGGAWKSGSKRGGHNRLKSLLDGKMAGASIAYRLTGEAVWPAQIHDCKAAIRWLRANAEELNIDPERIVVYGTSAGGHLVAMLGVTGDVNELEGKLGKHTDVSSRVAGVIDFFGPSDLLSMGQSPAIDHDAADSPESMLVGGKLADHTDKARNASPTSFVSENDPAFLIVHGDQDRLVPFQQSELLHQKLVDAGVSCRMIRMQNGGHGWFGVQPELTKRMKTFLGNVFEVSDEEISEKPIEVKPRKRTQAK